MVYVVRQTAGPFLQIDARLFCPLAIQHKSTLRDAAPAFLVMNAAGLNSMREQYNPVIATSDYLQFGWVVHKLLSGTKPNQRSATSSMRSCARVRVAYGGHRLPVIPFAAINDKLSSVMASPPWFYVAVLLEGVQHQYFARILIKAIGERLRRRKIASG
ncbi:MAG: hypothetical protein R3E89_09360 [Thiolinea sp.]